MRGLLVGCRSMRLRIPAAIAAAGLVIAACSGTETTTTTEPATTTTIESETTTTTEPVTTTTIESETTLEVVPRSYDEFRSQPTACGAQVPDPLTPMQFDAPADLGLDSSTPITAIISTSCGDIGIELNPLLAPETVNSFAFLATEGYFDGSVFHRVLPDFVAQGGDQTATGTGSPGYVLPDELPPTDVGYDRGILAMANSGPGTTGSQFFIVLDDTGLPPLYTIFGSVVDGLDVLDRLQAVPLGRAAGSRDPSPSTPLETLYINTVTIDP